MDPTVETVGLTIEIKGAEVAQLYERRAGALKARSGRLEARIGQVRKELEEQQAEIGQVLEGGRTARERAMHGAMHGHGHGAHHSPGVLELEQLTMQQEGIARAVGYFDFIAAHVDKGKTFTVKAEEAARIYGMFDGDFFGVHHGMAPAIGPWGYGG